MKVIASLVVISLMTTGAFAQTGKGSFMVGGTANIQSSKGNLSDFVASRGTGTSTSINLAPQIGYFVVNNLAVGIRPTISYAWKGKQNTVGTGIGPFVRYYFPFGKFAVFPELRASVSNSTDKRYYLDENGNTSSTLSKFKYGSQTYAGGIGLTWFAAQNVGIETVFSYNKVKNNPSDFKGEYVIMRFGIQFYLSRTPNE